MPGETAAQYIRSSIQQPNAFLVPDNPAYVGANGKSLMPEGLANLMSDQDLADLIAYAKRFAIPIVALTAHADSALARAATVALVYPDADEACPMGLAPTTSTTTSWEVSGKSTATIRPTAGSMRPIAVWS